jgi:acyl carrier protein
VLVLEVGAAAGDPAPIAAAARAAVIRDHDVAPAAVCLIPSHAIPKTSSGKIQRGLCRDALLRGELPILHRLEVPDEDRGGEAGPQAGSVDAAAVQDWLIRWSARATGAPAAILAPGMRLSEVGIDSLGSATLLWDLEAWLGTTIPITIAVGDPTLGELCASIAAHAARERR